MPAKIPLNVNGQAATVNVNDPQMPLLYALRNDLGLHGPRYGCGLGQCGACPVHIDGKAVRSCRMPVAKAAGKKVLTLEGLGSSARPHEKPWGRASRPRQWTPETREDRAHFIDRSQQLEYRADSAIR